MRLWHKVLISVLPQKHLIAQWRECCAIASNIAKNGTPNHVLVNPVIEYPAEHFIMYCNMIIDEMIERGIKVNETSYFKLFSNIDEAEKKNSFGVIGCCWVYEYWMDERYLKQCYYNLQEKYDRGMITSKEFQLIEDKYESLMIDELVN